MRRNFAAAALIIALSNLVSAATLIYDNSVYDGTFVCGGYDYFDYGTTTAGTVEKFAFAYNSSSATMATVAFYTNPQPSTFNPGTKLASFSIYSIPASTGAYSIYEYTVPQDKRFMLPAGTFGYSIRFTTASVGIVAARGGAGQDNQMWKYASGRWNIFWSGGSSFPGMYFKIYREPFIEEITCDITGRKFQDASYNGIWDAGEPVIEGCEIYLDTNNDSVWQNTEPKVETDAAGLYRFDNMPAPATYRVREIVQDRWIQTAPSANSAYQHVVVAQPNTVYGPLDFGNFPLPDSVTFSGRVTQENGQGFGAMTVDLDLDGDPLTYEQTAVTDDDGYYSFTLPAPWTGRAFVRLPDGWTTHEGAVHDNVVMNTTEDFVCAYGYDGGSGTTDDPYQVRTSEQLLVLSRLLAHWDKHFVLTADIDLAGEIYSSPIAGSNSYASLFPFSGTFDGAGFSIRNLHSTSGLFGYVRGAVIKNLGVENVLIEQGEVVGAVCNYNEGSLIENCFSTGTVSALYDAGGICGWSYRQYKGTGPMPDAGVPQIRKCYSTARITVRHPSRLPDSYASAGGLCGYAEDSVFEDNYTRGQVEGQGCTLPIGFDIVVRAGGLVGCISNCTLLRNYSASLVADGLDYSLPGGVCGRALGTNTLSGNFWDSDVCGVSSSACGTGMTTAQLQSANTFAGWDFQADWRICDGMNYPRLRWEPLPAGDFICPEGVELADLLILGDQWLGQAEELSADIAPAGEPDGRVDLQDLALLTLHWMAETD